MTGVLPAVLGWANGNDGTTGGENFRLYGLDAGPSPRWEKPHGRTIEKALRENGLTYEGDRFLVVYVGDRFSGARAEALAARIRDLLAEA